MNELATLKNQQIVDGFLANPENETAKMDFEQLAQEIYLAAEKTYKSGALGADEMLPALITQLKQIIKKNRILDTNVEVLTQCHNSIDRRVNTLGQCSPTDEVKASIRVRESNISLTYIALAHIINSALAHSAITTLNQYCQTYITHLEDKLKAADIQPAFHSSESSTPPACIRENSERHPLIQKHLAICNLQKTLTITGTPIDRLTAFHTQFSDESVKHTIRKHRDPQGVRFLKNVATFFASLLLGAGLVARAIYSSRQPGNSFSFWKSTGERVADKIDKELQRVNATIRCNA